MSASLQALRVLLALLKAQNLIYQDAHWEVRGPNFYGNHLLFERLYKAVLEHIDSLAEKMVAMYGPEAVNAAMLVRLECKWMDHWSKIECFHKRGLQAEADFEVTVDHAYGILEASEELSMGMDDCLMAMMNAHETHRYLLLQSLRS